MQLTKTLILIVALCFALSCKKTNSPTPTPNDNYTSVEAFLALNAPAIQTYTVDGILGGSFTSPQGTRVTIPPTAFVNNANQPVTGIITINFKDLYKKSDMLFSDMETSLFWGPPLKSAGEFFIKAQKDNAMLDLANGKFITIAQPAKLTGGLDTINIMGPFAKQDTVGMRGWTFDPMDSVKNGADDYVFSLYKFKAPLETGSWCNSDNSTYFNAYPQTTLTLSPTDSIKNFKTSVYLVFKTISSMIHVYDNGFKFPYDYAPKGLQCTLVAIGVKDGNLYSSFVPITISTNQKVNFTLSRTTSSEFKTQLKALD